MNIKHVRVPSLIQSSILFLITAITLLGCKTLSDPAAVERIGNMAYSIVKTGTAITLAKQPSLRSEFAKAANALTVLIDTDKADAVSVYAALSGLGIDELRGTEGVIAIQGGIALYELAAGKWWEPSSRIGTMTIATKIRDGINDALSGGQTAMSYSLRSQPRPYIPDRTKANTQKF